jgi:hypothetical protein
MQKNRINRFINSSLFVFIICGFIGALFFVHVFGFAILDFTYTDWLMNAEEDTPQHYLGWKLFRNSEWYFPVGLMDNIVYPFKESVMYTDSIPLFAILFKILSPILPNEFQYFGLFGILVYILQAGIAGLVIKKLCKNTLYSIIGSGFFVLSTVMMWRMYYHTALSAHFIILLCIYVWISKEKINTLKKNIMIWSGLLCLSALIHFYFVPMVIIFMLFYLLDDFLQIKKVASPLIILLVVSILLFATVFILGAFYSHAYPTAQGLGIYSTNLNSLFNPLGISAFLKGFPVIFVQYSGNAYLGFGLVLGIVILMSVVLKTVELKTIYENKLKLKKIVFIVGLILTFYIFALSPTVTLNSCVLFTYPLPKFIEYYWSIFRATGRMIWPVVYIIMVLVIWGIFRVYKVKTATFLLFFLLLIQYMDLRAYFFDKGNRYKRKTEWQAQLSSIQWSDLAKNHRHICFMQGIFYEQDGFEKLYLLMNFAAIYNLTINDSYLARKNFIDIGRYKKEEGVRIRNGEARDDTIYVFETLEESDSYAAYLHIYQIDNVIIGLKEE